jgi:uncharacterized RDD family membrane protein YckC
MQTCLSCGFPANASGRDIEGLTAKPTGGLSAGVLRRYRTFWPRFWAGWIDGLIFFPLWGVDWLVQKGTNAPSVLALWFVLYTLSFDIYSVVLHARYGQTLGKMAMGVKVLSLSETKLSLRQALLRDIVPILFSCASIFAALPRVLQGLDPYNEKVELTWIDEISLYGSLIWFAAELVTMLTNPKRRAVHDFIAGSVVVRLKYPMVAVSNEAAGA